MPRLFVGNFDLEHRLADPRFVAGARLRRINDELTFVWWLAASAGDAICCSGSLEPGFLQQGVDAGLPSVRTLTREEFLSECHARSGTPSSWEVTPWGWDSFTRRLVTDSGLAYAIPPSDAVRTGNSRRFSSQLESQANVGLPGAAAIRTMEALARHLSPAPPKAPWVLKAEFGMSARERLLGRGPELRREAERWAQARLARDGVIFWEPWVERVAEYGAQFEIPIVGAPVLVGVTALSVDAQGGYRGSAPLWPESRDESLNPPLEVCRQAANALQDGGYFGPVGFDMMEFRTEEGGRAWRPLQDINARWTMGRLAWEGQRLLTANECGELLFLPWNENDDPAGHFAAWQRQQKPGVRVLRLTPFSLDGVATSRGAVYRISPRT